MTPQHERFKTIFALQFKARQWLHVGQRLNLYNEEVECLSRSPRRVLERFILRWPFLI